MKHFYATIFSLYIYCGVMAQQPLAMPAIPPMRQLHHEYIIESLQKINDFIEPADSLGKNYLKKSNIVVTNIRRSIELNPSFDDNAKYRWLRSVNEMLTGFISACQSKLIMANKLNTLVNAYDSSMKLELTGQSVYPVFADNELEIGNILIDNYCLKNNPGIAHAKEILLWKYCQLHPEKILTVLSDHPNARYADTLIVQAAFLDPEKLYNYAAAPNALARRIQANNHPLVKIIGQLSLTKTGRMYIPFLDDLYHGRIKIDDITPTLTDEESERYYKLLVATRIEYSNRMQHGDTPLLENVLTAKLKSKAVELYINDINALHEINDPRIRFRKIENLSPQELYYLAVMGEAEMYTSSFVSGVYPRIFQRMTKPDSDSLLASVHDDLFKKFIKISAAYNTLDDFLKHMDSGSAKSRMRSFVDGLEKTKTLEEAVDVADSYASIYQPQLRDLILEQVQKNLQANIESKNLRGQRIYNLLRVIFQSMDTANHVDVSARLGIDPVYFMPNKRLQDSSGRIIMQQFFYGDKDGVNIFSAFLAGFNNGKWNIVNKPGWVEVSSKKGVPVTIYANRPLNEKLDLDEKAQDDLIEFLAEKKLTPTVVIHRGHSYHLQSTIDKLASSAKLVILGGCGGYQNLNKVLDICPGAHIISTKQVGTGVINKGLITEISEKLRVGQDLNWPQLWNNMSTQFKTGLKETFEDYVPPHKNLGAIFIMAYNKAVANKLL